jgi:hypothetical protein
MPLNSRELEPRLERLLLGVNGQYVMARPVVGDPLLRTAGRVHLNASITRSIAAQARLAAFMSNPAGSAIVNATGPIRQIVNDPTTSERRYLVIARGDATKLEEPIQVQTR